MNKATLVRIPVTLSDAGELQAALAAAGHEFRWAMGQLSWFRGHWEEEQDALPGAFFELFSPALLERPRANRLEEGIFSGAKAQVRVAATAKGLHAVLAFEESEVHPTLGAPWNGSEPVFTKVTYEDITHYLIQDTRLFGYAEKAGAFNGVFKSLQNKPVTIRQYSCGHSAVEWRFLPEPEGTA